MQNRKVVLLLIIFAFSYFCLSNETPAQNAKVNISEENAKSNPFKEGETQIAQVKFTGLDSDYETDDENIGNSVFESDVSMLLQESRATISADEKFSSVKVEKVIKLLKEWLSAKGYPKAQVVALGEKLPKKQMKLIFSVKRGAIVRVSEIRFVGNKNISNEEFVENLKNCLGDDNGIFDKRKYEYYTRKCSQGLMFSKGYFQARIERLTPRLISDNYVVTVEIKEGIRYRIGEITIKGAKTFTEKEILEMYELKAGDVADGSSIQDFFYEKLKRIYADKGYVSYISDFDPKFIEPQAEGLDGTVNIFIDIDEGIQFRLADIEFTGVEKEKSQQLRQFISLKDKEVFNQSEIEKSIKKIDDTKEFYPINFDNDVEIRVDEENGELYIVIKLTEIK